MKMSKHAAHRSKQRGIARDVLELILEHADVDRPIGDGCTLVGVSRRRAMTVRGAEGLHRYRLIESGRSGQFVTAMIVGKGRFGRRYRRSR